MEDGTPVAMRCLVDSSSPGGMPGINCNLPKRIRGTNQVDVDVVHPFSLLMVWAIEKQKTLVSSAMLQSRSGCGERLPSARLVPARMRRILSLSESASESAQPAPSRCRTSAGDTGCESQSRSCRWSMGCASLYACVYLC